MCRQDALFRWLTRSDDVAMEASHTEEREISEYVYLPDVHSLAEQLRSCLQVRVVGTPVWRGDTRVACGVWRVACGVWRVACGVWRMVCGVCSVLWCGRSCLRVFVVLCVYLRVAVDGGVCGRVASCLSCERAHAGRCRSRSQYRRTSRNCLTTRCSSSTRT